MAAASVAVGVFATRLFVDKADEARQQEFEEFAEELENNRPLAPESPIKETSAINTVDWQTYRNEEYGFEFRHPFVQRGGALNTMAEFMTVNYGGLSVIIVEDNLNNYVTERLNDNSDESYFISEAEKLTHQGRETILMHIDAASEYGGSELLFGLDNNFVLRLSMHCKCEIHSLVKDILSTFKFNDNI
jgi:hypothetical protein